MKRTKAAAAILAAAASACAERAAELPPYGEALFVVDTDLPVPALASRLRVDLYGADGTWIESRDIGRSDPRDWPASFGIYTSDENRPRDVLVRLRAYPEGIVRDYEGERFDDRLERLVEPKAAMSLDEACRDAPLLPFGERVRIPIGTRPITDHVATPRCHAPAAAGAAIARVTIPAFGTYRFDVAGLVPYEAYTTLSLRRACADATSQIACESEPQNGSVASGSAHFPRFDVVLDPGTYFLVADGTYPSWPVDVELEASPVDAPLPPHTTAPPATPSDPRPRLVTADGDVTPSTEPLPSATIDRLALVHLEPGRRGRASIVLRASCAGTMAKLGADPTRPDLRSAASCVDDASRGGRVAIAPEVLDPDLGAPVASHVGESARRETCDGTAPVGDRVCVPGGIFLLGSRLVTAATGTIGDATPERIAIVSRFFVDRSEVTVARMRAAIAAGLVRDDASLTVNDTPFPAASELAADKPFEQARFCSYSREPMGREDLPVTCIAWDLARAFCQRAGGDLPSEAQWEYAAIAAGRAFQTLYPWGDEAPSCARSVFANVPPSLGTYACGSSDGPAGPRPVDAARGPDGSDVTPNGIVGMGGNVDEWMRDGGEAYEHDCWRAAGLVDPECRVERAPRRAVRGYSWIELARPLAVRGLAPPRAATGQPNVAPPLPFLGFRCVYGGPR